MRRSLRIFITLTIMAILATGAYAFTAANTVETSNAGDGSGTIDGFDVTNISWDIDDLDPTQYEGVTFDISPAAAEVFARVDGGPWATCADLGGGTSWDCTLSGAVVSASSLQVVAGS